MTAQSLALTVGAGYCLGCAWTSNGIDSERETAAHTRVTDHATMWRGEPASLTTSPPEPVAARSRTAPSERGRGLIGPPCAWRIYLDQYGTQPLTAMCVQCGRITGRRDGSGLPWCGGVLAEEVTL